MSNRLKYKVHLGKYLKYETSYGSPNLSTHVNNKLGVDSKILLIIIRLRQI